MLMRIAALVLFAAGATAALAQPAKQPGAQQARVSPPAAGGEHWLAELMVTHLRVPKDELAGEMDALVRGYQERLNKLNPSPQEFAAVIQLVEQERAKPGSVDPVEFTKRVQSARENGGDIFAEFLMKYQSQTKPGAEQFERLAVMQQTFDPAAPIPMNPVTRTQAIIETLPEALALREDQRKQFDELLLNLQESAEKRDPATLYHEMQNAQRGGADSDGAVTRRFEEAFAQYETQVASFLERVDGILDPQQKAQFAPLREQALGYSGMRTAGDRQPDAKTILRAARALHLDPAQRDSLDELTRTAARMVREAGREEQAQQAVSSLVMDELRRMLRPEQFSDLERRLGTGNAKKSRRDAVRSNRERPTDAAASDNPASPPPPPSQPESPAGKP